MSRLIERTRRVAVRSVPVLIEGESGTGKELVARAPCTPCPIAPRARSSPSTAAPSRRELVDSQLFGHEKGAFTGDAWRSRACSREADGGTLFLDELGELPASSAQVKLLRALQEGEIVPRRRAKPVKVDVRIVAATTATSRPW